MHLFLLTTSQAGRIQFIEHDLMETMKQNKTKNMIKSDIQFVATVALPEKQENLEEKQNNLRNLCMTTFSRLTSTLDSIQKETKVYFDLNKISNDTAGNAKLIGKIKYENKSFPPKKFLKIKNLVNDIEILRRYESFEEFIQADDDLNGDSRQKRLEAILKDERLVYFNGNAIKYPNLFINFDAHDLETLYNNVFPNCSIQCKEILDKMNTGIIVTDELVQVFRNLCNNITEITQESFEWTVFNSNKDWFIKITDKRNQLDEYILKAYESFYSFVFI